MAYDRDGSIVAKISTTNVVTQLSAAQVAALNDESDASPITVETSGTQWAFLFPEARDFDAFALLLLVGAFGGSSVVEVSPDTTNGLDGTWSQVAAPSYAANTNVLSVPAFRTAVQSVTALGVRGVRVRINYSVGAQLYGVHLYGERSPGQALNALELWHPTADEKLPPAWLDWGNTPRGSSEDRTFRVKNISTTSTAEAVRVAFDVLTDGSPSVPGQHLLSYGGGSFLAQVNVGDLAPGAISGAVTVRRVTASNAQLGVFAFRVFAEPDAWA